MFYFCSKIYYDCEVQKNKHSSRLSDDHLHGVSRVSTTSLQGDIESL